MKLFFDVETSCKADFKATGADFADKHDALCDVRAMIRVHFWRLEAEAKKISANRACTESLL